MATRPTGRLKGRFEIMEQIGEGGFASVFRAKESTTGKIVALKLLKDAYLKDQEVVERFRREVFAVASINSPYVVRMHDFGISGDEVFIAMEYVEGPTLREVMHERPWSPNDIHVIVGQIAQALAAAHRQNIVHRDLKPENVILVGDGGKTQRQVKVLDFGLAKLAELERKLELEPLTRAGMCFGTPQYMSPEQIQGKNIDGSADVYALAVIAYEMIAGLLPWDGSDSREILLSVIKTPAPKILRARAPVKKLEDMNRFLQRALAKDKKERPRDAADFFREFEIALFGERQKPAQRPKGKLDAKDEVFASVFAASIEMAVVSEGHSDFDDTRVETVPGEFPIEPTMGGPGIGTLAGAMGTMTGTMTGVRRRRRMKSEWMSSVGLDSPEITGLGDPREDPSGPFAHATTMPHHSPRRNKVPSEAMPLPPLDFAKRRGRKDSVTDVLPPLQRREARGVPGWVVVAMLLLVLVAAAIGFWVGRRPH
jgi:serine/threonine protein kinase